MTRFLHPMGLFPHKATAFDGIVTRRIPDATRAVGFIFYREQVQALRSEPFKHPMKVANPHIMLQVELTGFPVVHHTQRGSLLPAWMLPEMGLKATVSVKPLG